MQLQKLRENNELSGEILAMLYVGNFLVEMLRKKRLSKTKHD
jgi:hypothetical protein